MLSTTDTIVAIATPAGRGGVGIVRLSGPEAAAIASRLTRRTTAFVPRRATLATLHDPSAPASALDHVVVTWFKGPASYTGEDVIELGAHGSPVVLEAIVRRAMDEGARLAEPGEFTLRAYLHGRVDLIQAEAVADLIDAVTPLQARAAADQLDGTLTRTIAAIDADLFDLAARLEASLDFPEEGFHFITRDDAVAALDSVWSRLERLARDGRRGRMIREGATVVIAGRPNAGKSTLFNALAGVDRAIVTDVPGTTRDLLTERIDLDGIAVTIVDTAGLREAGDAIEAEGVRRARDAQAAARLVIFVIDGSTPLSEDDRAWLDPQGPHGVVVISKADLPAAWTPPVGSEPRTARVSVPSGEGINAVRRRIVGQLTGEAPRTDPPAISNVRHLALVDDARVAIERASLALADGSTEELVLAEMEAARTALEAIVGRRAPDDLLRHIFGKFCVGK